MQVFFYDERLKSLAFTTVDIGISRSTSPFTVTTFLITWRVVQTVTSAVTATVITIGTVITLYKTKYVYVLDRIIKNGVAFCTKAMKVHSKLKIHNTRIKIQD